MPNFQPNFIYSPLYGSRYLGGSRAHSPSTGKAGEVENASVQRSSTVGGPAYVSSDVTQGQPVGWSGTGRDQSGVSSLGNFGFVPIDTANSFLNQEAQEAPEFQETDDYFDIPTMDSTGSFQVPTTATQDVPAISFSSDDSDYRDNLEKNYGQGIVDPDGYETQFFNFLSDYGQNPFAPGAIATKFISDKFFQSQEKALEEAEDKFDNAPKGVTAVKDNFGNVTYEWDRSIYPEGDEPNMNPNEFRDFLDNVKDQGGVVTGLDASGNINYIDNEGNQRRSQSTGSSANFNLGQTTRDLDNTSVSFSQEERAEQEDQDQEDSGGGYYGGDPFYSEGGYIPASQSVTQGMSMGNVTKFTQKDRYGNMLSIEFDVPKQMEIPHPGHPMGTDTVPAWLTPGERVMNAEAERMYGPILEDMNDQGRALQAAQGGTIPEYAACGSKVKHKSEGGVVYAQGGGRPDEWFYDPKMLDAIRQVESGGDPNAVSKAGAIGPYQILPSTAANPGYNIAPISLEDAKDEKKAREFAMNYLAALQSRNPDASPEQILQMYNAGEGRVRADIAGTGSKPLEEETIQYGDKVLAEFGAVPPINNVSQAVPEVAEAGPQAMQETITSVPRLESVEDYAKYYNNQLLAGRGDRETYENALVDQFGISKGQAQALINSEYAGEGLITGLKTPQEFIDDIESGNILGSDLARVGDPLPRKAVDLDLDDTFQVAPLSGIEVPPSTEQPPSPLTGLDNVFVEQPEDDRGQAYGDGLRIQLQAVEQQLANLQQEAKDPLKSPELIGSITELRNQRTRLADMYDEWAKTQGEKQALGYGTEDKVPSYTQEDVEVESPVGSLEERRKRSLVTKEKPTKTEPPESIDVATQESNKEKAITELEENTTTDPSETPSQTPKEVENNAKKATPEQKQEAKSFFDEWGLSELFNKKEIGKMMALYLGSRALGYSHNGSLNFAAKNYVKGIDRIAKVADKLAVEGKHTKASIKEYRKSGDMTDLILKPVKPKRISAEPLNYFIEGANFNKGRVKLYEWEDQATKSRYLGDAAGNPIDMSKVHNEAFRVEGSPEYNKRIRASIDQIKPLFAEFDKNLNRGGDAGGDPLIAILPESATQQAARWAVVNDLDITKLEGIVRGAYSDALAQKQRDPKTEISDIQPFLNQQVIRSYTGNPNLLQYQNDEGEFVPIDSAKLTVVNKAIANRIGTQWKDLRVDDLMNQYMASKEQEWVELGKNNPSLVDKYNNRANEGENGFLLFMLDDFGLLDKGRMK